MTLTLRFVVLALSIAAALLAPHSTRAQAAPTSRTVRINDIEMHYEVRGTGEPLLLLHGFFGCGKTFEPFFERLSATYRLIIPDLRGHGRTTNPGGTFTHGQSARDVLALLDTLGLRRVRALGVSTGGMTLLHLTTRHPDRVEAMVLVGATTHFPEQARAIMRETTSGDLTPEARNYFLQCAARGEAQVDALRKAFGAFRDTGDDMKFTASELGIIKARTLIVHGDRDEFFPVDIPVAMYKGIPGSALWIVPRGEHVPILGPLMPVFLDLTLRFFQGDAGRQR
jgi:pimeloyl-ACP methyl ester carboxylesterase